jgi:hypothetical protein
VAGLREHRVHDFAAYFLVLARKDGWWGYLDSGSIIIFPSFITRSGCRQCGTRLVTNFFHLEDSAESAIGSSQTFLGGYITRSSVQRCNVLNNINYINNINNHSLIKQIVWLSTLGGIASFERTVAMSMVGRNSHLS